MPSSETLPIFFGTSTGDLVLSPLLGHDVIVALTAKVSRSPDGGYLARIGELLAECEKRGEPVPTRDNPTVWIENPPSSVVDFCRKVLGSYGHGSPADCGGPALYVDRIGWPSAWLLEDFPLWNGQENSTRAVTRHGELGKCCRFAPSLAQELHDDWMEVYESEIRRLSVEAPSTLNEFESRRWILDRARWALPGTAATGVSTVTHLRAVLRHVGYLSANKEVFVRELADTLKNLSAIASPIVTKYAYRDRTSDLICRRRAFTAIIGSRCENRVWADGTVKASMGVTRSIERLHSDTNRDYLDHSSCISIPPVHISFRTSIAAARDWHRHRPVMPWCISVCVNNVGDPLFADWAHTSSAPASLIRKTFDNWNEVRETLGPWTAAHCLPFGVLVYLSCRGFLPDVLYMLELRAESKGANFEYRDTALDLLGNLRSLFSLHKYIGNQSFTVHE